MKELISLPEEYMVHKTLTVKHFLKGAQLTEKNKKDIEKTVSRITLMYDVRFPDQSEIILIDVELKHRLLRKTDCTIAGIIAQAIPYHCILYMHDEEYGRLVVFLTRPNTVNNSRRIIMRKQQTPFFNIRDIPSSIQNLLSNIETELKENGINAEISIINCFSHIENMEDRDESKKISQLIREQHSILAQLEYGAEHADAVIEKVPYDECIDTESENWDFEDDHNITQRLSVESLCACAYAIYCEYTGPLDDYEWLLQYAICCNETMFDLYRVSVTDSFYQKLGAFFSKREFEYSDNECIYIVGEKMQEALEEL